MITAWGEFTFTLEDVCVLLELPCIGKDDFHSIKLSEEEVCTRDFFFDLLKSLSKTSKVAPFSNWIGVFYKKLNAKGIEIDSPEYPDHKYELVALIIFWLARHVLQGCPDDGISSVVVPLAIKIIKGIRFPLAPLYLGSLYKRLDLYQLKIIESAGRYKVLTYVDVSFIQMCLWERFGTCAHMPNAYPFASFSMNNLLSRNNYRAWAWHDRLQKGNVIEMMDVTKEFNHRPYVQPINGFGDPAIYYDLHPLQSGRMSSRGINFCIWVHSSHLPSMIESSNSGGDRNFRSVEVYSPYRVARQFGFDQPAPPDSSSPISFSSCVSSFLMTGLSLHLDKLKSCTIPAFDRVGIHTSGWFAYWGECLGEWRSFTVPLTNPTARLYTPHVSNNDVS
ncbi:PREDICTED: uncharacterized protein LOC18608829 [Theobroma cacao]|uniref:Uncharacterized protein LOC18608829 n=1 Tax=Theobroma cacao TaxID=3641 RepID=A0AB32VX19_THECC|nr:PREDICTED: uncharacterized protein LOC18608829 [Theobroma cacao]